MALAKTTAKKPVRKAAKKVTMDDVWVTINEIGVAHRELEKAMEETQKAQARTEKAQERTQKAIEETQKSIGGLSKTVGNIAENLLVPNLVDKFAKLGFTFQVINAHRRIADYKHDIHAEIDAFLENGKQAMAVEVKATCRRDDVDEHIERMEKIRRHADLHKDKRQFVGAIAATVIDETTRRYALKQGFYLIEPSGEDVKIVKPSVEKFW